MKGLVASLPLLLLPLVSGQTSEVSTLRQRCAEQERQIRDLEVENSRLRSLLERDGSDSLIRPGGGKVLNVTTDAKPLASTSGAGGGAATATGSYTIKAGDSLSKVARKYGTTPETLARLNSIKNPALIQVGQVIKVPAKGSATPAPAPAPAADSPKSPDVAGPPPPTANAGKTHTVKKGETYFRIAQMHGTTVKALEKANPGVDAARLKIGQKIKLSATAAVPATAPRTELKPTTPEPEPDPLPEPGPVPDPKPSVNPKPAADPKPDTTPMPAPEPADEPAVRLIRITEAVTFGDFAKKYNTTVAKLNELNGQTLNATTLLAKDSELYVPVAP